MGGFNVVVGITVDTRDIKKVESTFGQMIKRIDTMVKTASGEKLTRTVQTFTREVKNSDGTVTKYVQTVKGLKNAQDQWVDSTGKVLKNQGGLVTKQEQTTKAVKTSTQAINANTQALNAQAKSAQNSISIFDNFANSITNLAKLKIANSMLNLFSEACGEAKDAILDLDGAIVEFNKVSDLKETGNLQNYIEQLGELGQTVGRTQAEMLEGATQFVKSGFSEKDAQNLAQVNAMFQNVADSEMGAEESARILIATMKAFNTTADDTIHIVDTINSISNTQAVSSTDISDGLANVASTAHAAKNSLEETAGMLTAMVTETQSAAKSSRGLRQIISRLTQTLDENSGTGQKLRDIYEGLGISLYDADGQLRSTYDILSELSQAWGTLDSNTQQYIALTSAGSNQVNNFLALMNNFDIAVESTATALDSAGSAAKENAAAMDSIEMRLKTLSSSFQRLVNGDGGLNSFVKSMISTATAIVDFVNKIGGLKTVLTTLASAGIIVAIANFEKLIKTSKLLKAQFVDLVTYIPNQVTKALMTLDDAAIGLATAEEVAAANATLLKVALSGVVAAIGIAVIAWQNYQRAQEEARQAALDTAETYKQEQEDIAETLNKIESEATSREELCKIIKDSLGDAYDQEKEDLKDINTLREDGLKLLYEEAQAKAKEVTRTTSAQAGEAEDFLTGNYKYFERKGGGSYHGHSSAGASFSAEGTPEEVYVKMGEKIDELNKKKQDGIDLSKNEQALLKQLEEDYAELGDKIDENKTIYDAYQEAVKTLEQTFEEWIGASEEAQEAIEENADAMQTLGEIIEKYGYESYDDFAKAVEDAGGSMDDFLDALEEGSNAAEDYLENQLGMKDAAEQLSEAIEEEKEAYEQLNSIIEKYNETGQLTQDMLEQLASISPQYLANLNMENDAIGLNVDLMTQQFEVQKQLALINVQTAEQLAIVAVCEQTLGEETSETTAQLYEDEQQAYALESAYGQLESAAYKAADAMRKVREAGKDTDEFYQAIEDARKPFDELEKSIKETEITTHKATETGTKGAKSVGSANKKAAEDTKDAWKEAYEEEEKVLEHMHEMGEISDEEFYRRLLELNERYFGEASGNHEKYLDEYRKNEEKVYKGLVSAYKDKVKKQKDAALKAIDAEINAVKKAKDAALKAIDEKIKALKKQKEAAIKAVEAEIKALEKAKETQHKYLQEKIDALQRAHDLQEKINKLEEYENQLAQAKQQRVWVMKDGQFQLGENEEAINSAEQQLSDYKDDLDYERQIQELQDLQEYWDEYYDNLIEKKEEYKEYLEEYYDAQIEAMEEYRDRVEEEYEAQIEALEEYRDQVEEMYDEMLENYQEHVKEMLEKFDEFNKGNEEKYGVAIEALRAFVSEWNSLIESMESIDGTIGAVTGFASGMVSLKGHSAGAAEIGAYASGNNSSVKDNEIALVGESPNTEMLIGSKLNSGVVARLHKGSGVVNAESTKTLAGILNGLGKNSYVGNGTSGVTQQFSFGSISLPNVTDANSFVEALKNTFSSYSIKYASVRT